jgi:sugar O-acyltransferase (sialic acid O-acetyltransferase NeuD family)
MENPVMIFGAGSLGAAALDIFKRNNVVVYGFLDDKKELHTTEIDDVAVLGSTDDEGFTKLIGKKCEAFVAVDSPIERKAIVEMLVEHRKTMPINAIHDKALVSKLASIGHGNFIGANVLVGARASIGQHNILNAGVLIETDAEVDNYVQIGAGSIVGSKVQIADNAFIGTGVTIVAGIKVGKGARIGAGSVVVDDVPARATVFGNPAKKV